MRTFNWIQIWTFFGVLLLNPTLAFAKATASYLNSPEFIEIKSKTEQLISKRYRDQLSTQLDANSFTVNANVVLIEKPKKAVIKTDPNINLNVNSAANVTSATNATMVISIQPEDLTSGIVTLTPLLQLYQDEISQYKKQLSDQLQAQQIQALQMHAQQELVVKESLIDNLEIKGVEVLVGLDSGFSSTYRREIDEWLQKAIEADFGKIGSHKVTTIRKVIKPEEPPKVLTPIEKITSLQILLGFVVLAGVVLLGLLAHKWILSRDVREQTRTALKIQEMKAAQLQAERRDQKSNLVAPSKKELATDKAKESNTNPAGIQQNCRELQQKISMLHLRMESLTQNLFEIWFDQGVDGRFKAASFIDAVLSRRTLDNGKDLPEVSDSVIFPEKWRKDTDLHQVFREFPQIAPDEKNIFLEQVYWDMLSVNLLGSKALRMPFEVLLELTNDKLERILAPQDSKIKALALLHLPTEKIQSYLSNISEADKQKIVESSLTLQQVRIEDLESADESVKFKAKQEDSSFGFIQLSEQLPNILFSLSVREELSWLPTAFSKLPDMGNSIKKQYPSVAFISEWPDEQLKQFFVNLDLKLISAYLHLVPSMGEKIQSFLPSRAVLMIRDELNNRRGLTEAVIDKNINQLKEQLQSQVQAGTINLETIFSLRISAEISEQTRRSA